MFPFTTTDSTDYTAFTLLFVSQITDYLLEHELPQILIHKFSINPIHDKLMVSLMVITCEKKEP